MKRHVLLAALVLVVSVLATGVLRPQGAVAFKDCSYDDGCVHETLINYAIGLYPDISHHDSIKGGASHEDHLDHVYDRIDSCVTITHFWDPDTGFEGEWEYSGCPWDDGLGPNAYWKARIMWGMALGEYHSGDTGNAYHYLGHVAHLLADMAVPAHVHYDTHPEDDYEDIYFTGDEAAPNDAEYESLLTMGPTRVPEGFPILGYLFYSTAQYTDFYASDDDSGDADEPLGWLELGVLEDVPECRDKDRLEDECDFAVIRRNTYFPAIRATAALFEHFADSIKQQAELTVVIDRVTQIEGHGATDDPDYFVHLKIGDRWYKNEGDQAETCTDCSSYPGWAFARDVGLTGTTTVHVELWDDDGISYDHSDVDPRDDDRVLDVTVDLYKCMAGEADAVSGDVAGACGGALVSAGDQSNRSEIEFRILPPNAPPVAEAGPDQTVNEADLVTLSGSFTDPNVGDTHTLLWHLEGTSGVNCVDVPDAETLSLSFTPIDDCEYTFSFTVTDSHGAEGSDSVVVTVVNVPPVAGIDSITDETGAQIGVDVPVALAGLEIDLTGSFTDVGTVDTHIAAIDWGDDTTNTDEDFDIFGDCLGGSTGILGVGHIYAVPGIYTITLSVTDDDGGVGTATAEIEVVDAAGAIAAVIESLAPLAGVPGIQAAIDKLQGENGGAALSGALDMLDQGNPNAALEKIKQALADLQAAEAANPGLDLTYDKGLLALAAKSVAVGLIAKAEAVAFKPEDLLKIQAAKALVTEGDALLAAHGYVAAVNKYQQAVRIVHAIGAAR